MTRALVFRKLHEGPGAFVIANAWDAGSARILAALGFPALATSSGACAGVLGRRDGTVTREEALAHARAIVEATDLPVSADLEKGFGDAPSRSRRDDPNGCGRRALRGVRSRTRRATRQSRFSISATRSSASPPRSRPDEKPALC